MGDAILHFIFITILLNPKTYEVIGYALLIAFIGLIVYLIVGILSWIILFLITVCKFVVRVLQIVGVLKKPAKSHTKYAHNFKKDLGEGSIVDLGDHIGVLIKIDKKRIAEDYLREQKEKSYSERMEEAMYQEAQAKGWG